MGTVACFEKQKQKKDSHSLDRSLSLTVISAAAIQLKQGLWGNMYNTEHGNGWTYRGRLWE